MREHVKKGGFVGAITDRPKCKRYEFAEMRSAIRRLPAGRSMIAPTVLRFFDSLKCRDRSMPGPYIRVNPQLWLDYFFG